MTRMKLRVSRNSFGQPGGTQVTMRRYLLLPVILLTSATVSCARFRQLPSIGQAPGRQLTVSVRRELASSKL